MLLSLRPLDPDMISAPFVGTNLTTTASMAASISISTSTVARGSAHDVSNRSAQQASGSGSTNYHHHLWPRNNQTGHVIVPLPTRTSTGCYETLPKKNVQAAQKHAHAVRTIEQARTYWRS